jgi:hypothetical protein
MKAEFLSEALSWLQPFLMKLSSLIFLSKSEIKLNLPPALAVVFWRDLRAFSRDLRAFGGDLPAFGGDLPAFGRDLRAFSRNCLISCASIREKAFRPAIVAGRARGDRFARGRSS